MGIRKQLEQPSRETILAGGAPVVADKKVKKVKDGWAFMTLRLPEEIIKEIDFVIKDELLLSRTSWIITAIKKRLEDEYGR